MPDELAGLKKLLAQLDGTDAHCKMVVKMSGEDVTQSWTESLKWEIKKLESHLEKLKK